MSVVTYPNKRWRHDADGYYRLIGSGGGAIPAVIACATPSSSPDTKGQFWWGVNALISGYKPTLEEAKAEAEKQAVRLEEA